MKSSIKVIPSILALMITTVFMQAQTITIQGNIAGENKEALVFPIIANKTTGHCVVANNDGSFTLTAEKTDTILFTANSYGIYKFCAADSSNKNTFSLQILLPRRVITMKELIVHDIKTITDINKEKENLGIKRTDDYNEVDGFNSPITWLYERFSKKEKDKRLVAELENKDRQISILKDLFRNYISYDIMEMDESEFENFINYMQLPEYFIKNASDYDLAITIKSKYLKYKNIQSIKY